MRPRFPRIPVGSTPMDRAIAIFFAIFLTFMFHTVVQQGFLRNGEKYYVYFIDNLLLFPTMKESSKSVNI